MDMGLGHWSVMRGVEADLGLEPASTNCVPLGKLLTLAEIGFLICEQG